MSTVVYSVRLYSYLWQSLRTYSMKKPASSSAVGLESTGLWGGDPWAAAAQDGDTVTAAEEDAFFGRVWASLGRGGYGEREDLAQVGDLQRVRYGRPAWGKLVVAYRAATRRAKVDGSYGQRSSGRVTAPPGRHQRTASSYGGDVELSAGGSAPVGWEGGVGLDD
jgi:hypothetical protein